MNFLLWLRNFIERFVVEDPDFRDCARCDDCNRIVRDFVAPDGLWLDVIGSEGGVLCYNCFCHKARAKGYLGVFKISELEG